MLEMMKKYLEWYGLTVSALLSGAEAVTKCKQENFDLFLCSAWLESGSGYEVGRRVRLEAKLPVMILIPEVPNYEEFRKIGENGFYYIMKYKSPDQIYSKIVSIIEKERSAAIQK